MTDPLLWRAAPVAALVALFTVTLGFAAGQDSASSIVPAGTAGVSSAPALPAASDADLVAQGKHVWNDAACYNCHGKNGQGGHSADFPAGPNLRTSGLDPATMLLIIECGLPNTRMPAWLKGAYTEVACNGAPLGPAPADVMVSGAYGPDDLKAVVDYIQTSFMNQPMPKWSDQ